MTIAVEHINMGLGILALLVFIWAAIVSVKEGEKRAISRFIWIAILSSALFGFVAFFDPTTEAILNKTILIAVALLLIILILPINNFKHILFYPPQVMADERDIMFSRRKLEKGTERFEDYYTRHPQNLASDEAFRKEAGLLSDKSSNYEPLVYHSSEASFQTVAEYLHKVEGPVADTKTHVDPNRLSNYLKKWSKKAGALELGICEIKPYHWYSHGGKEWNYGEPIQNDHQYAIAFTVEMDDENTRSGPLAPIVMESAQQYLNAGSVAMQIANFIRNLGYDARAHLDGNYQVVCPLVARDAGLGELGRMGLLMTPKLGPRVRIGVVTTAIPLQTDEPTFEPSVIDFCNKCKKCADCCPSNSISFTDREEHDGVKRWKINSDTCFHYWTTSGTDCGRCMSVCPYSHPDKLLHNIVRKGIRHSLAFRTFALKMDDFIYGKKPPVRPIPQWMKIKN